MTTVLEECTTEEQRYVVRFFYGQKDSMQMIFVRWEVVAASSGSQLGRETYRNFADDERVETEVRKWLRQRSKEFYAAGSDALVKRWDKRINFGREIKGF
jgi:hypothetical protein